MPNFNMKERLKEIREILDERWKFERWVTLEEADILYMVADVMQPEYIFESGTANGYSALWLAESGSPVITFDPTVRKKVWDELGLPHSTITYVQASFTELPKLYPELKERSKLFFIDGGHSVGAAARDYMVISAYAKEDDIVMIHDINERGVRAVWNRLRWVSKDPVLYDTFHKIGKVTWTG